MRAVINSFAHFCGKRVALMRLGQGMDSLYAKCGCYSGFEGCCTGSSLWKVLNVKRRSTVKIIFPSLCLLRLLAPYIQFAKNLVYAMSCYLFTVR